MTSTLRVRTLPGSAVVARAGDGVLVVDAADAAHHAAAGALLAALREVCSGAGATPGDTLVRRLVSAVVTRPPTEVPPFAAVAPGGGGLAVLLTPGTELTWESGGEQQRLSGANATNWLDRVLPGEVGTVTVGVEPIGAGEPTPFSDLRDGVVSGAAAVLDRAAVAPLGLGAAADADADADATELDAIGVDDTDVGAEAVEAGAVDAAAVRRQPVEPPPVAPEPQAPPPAPSFEIVELGGLEASESRGPLPVADDVTATAVGAQSVSAEAPAADPAVPPPPAAPIVRGKRCVRSHFNHPEARYCNACGINFHQLTVNPVDGPRPPLGILLLDDGSAFTLDSDYVVGREPELAPEVLCGRARPLTLEDAQRSVSRVHATIALEGWDVTLIDRGSANGTFVLLPGAAAWSPLPTEQPTTIPSGARIALGKGGRTIVFESHHVSDR